MKDMQELRQINWRWLSGSGLKLLAMALMIIDHTAGFYLRAFPAFVEPMFTLGHHGISWYFICRCIGRIGFPIFAFLIVEGFLHTHDRKKYGLNLLIFALVSEVPWNLVHSGTWHHPTQNVLFTLLLGYLGLCALEYYAEDKLRLALALIGLLVVSVVLHADYGCNGYAFILFLYALRQNRLVQAVIGCGILGSRWMGGLAFIPINMYNGQRGFIQGRWAKYIFYVFYPAHLLILYFMQEALMR